MPDDDISYPDLNLPRENETRHVIVNQLEFMFQGVTEASEDHTLNSTFDNAEVKAALDAQGEKINEILTILKEGVQ